jgi:hypothetical protein
VRSVARPSQDASKENGHPKIGTRWTKPGCITGARTAARHLGGRENRRPLRASVPRFRTPSPCPPCSSRTKRLPSPAHRRPPAPQSCNPHAFARVNTISRTPPLKRRLKPSPVIASPQGRMSYGARRYSTPPQNNCNLCTHCKMSALALNLRLVAAAIESQAYGHDQTAF